MNNVCLVGRLVRDPELRYTQAGKANISFSVAVDRKYDREKADFINCKAWDKTAEFIGQYFKKGMKIGLIGRIETGSYEKDGRKIYTTDVVVENAEFVQSKQENAVESAMASVNGQEIVDFDVNDIFL